MFAWIKNWLNPTVPEVVPEPPPVKIWRFMPMHILLPQTLELGEGYSIFVSVNNQPIAKYFDIVALGGNFTRTCNLLNYGSDTTVLNFNKPLNLRCDPGVVDIDIVQDNAIVASFKNIEIDHDFK